MFYENKPGHFRSRGSVEVITGSMFSGKTEELIRRLKRSRIAKQQVEVFKPVVDKRFDEAHVVSHDENALGSTSVETASQILLMVSEDIEVVGIDEAQFFDQDLVYVCNQLADMGIRVIVAGLDIDYLGKPFGPVPDLLAIAEYVTKVHAICQRCGDLAHHSHRTGLGNDLVMLGEKNNYEPLCRRCFLEEKKKRI
jgi:thymidine kinase